MACRELFVFEIMEILRLWVRGRGMRTVARQAGVDRKTVRRYVEAGQDLPMKASGGAAGDPEVVAEGLVG